MANSLEMMLEAANLVGVTVISLIAASVGVISSPSGVQAADTSEVTRGMRKSWDSVMTTVATCIATEIFSSGSTMSGPTCSGCRIPPAELVNSDMTGS